MKKLIWLCFIVLLSTISSQAQMCKRKGIIDCKGQCGRFTDKDGDGYCDFSPRSTPAEQPKTEVAKTTPADTIKKQTVIEKKEAKKECEVAKIKVPSPTSTNKVVPNPESETATDTSHPGDSTEKSTQIDSTAVVAPASQTPQEETKEKPYALIEIAGITLLFYLFTTLLVRLKVIKKVTHRKIWNVILLITFIMSGLIGLLLVAQLNYNFAMDSYLRFLKWHVEFGIAMAIISVIHALWHTQYYINMLKKKKK